MAISLTDLLNVKSLNKYYAGVKGTTLVEAMFPAEFSNNFDVNVLGSLNGGTVEVLQSSQLDADVMFRDWDFKTVTKGDKQFFREGMTLDEKRRKELLEILNLNDRYLVLNFSGDEIVIKFDARMYKFLNNLIGVSLDKLELICSQVGLSELKNKIRELKRTKIYFQENEILAFDMFKDRRFKMVFDPSFSLQMDEKLTFSPMFDENYMGLKFKANYLGSEAQMICAGSVYTDYVKFINLIKEAA